MTYISDMNNGKRKFKYQYHPGRNSIFCKGRIIMARQYSVLIITLSLITGTAGLFFGFDCYYLSTHVSIAIPIVAVILYVFVISVLLRCSLSDPGFLPRARPDETKFIEAKALETLPPQNSAENVYRAPPRVIEIIVNNQTIKLKYCFTCKFFRPPRASHCSICDCCVENFDHHCPWVGNCVGKRNYRFFYLFLLSLSILTVYIFVCNVIHMVLRTQNTNFLETLKYTPATIVEMLICFFTVWSILGLAGFHTYLVTSFLTTNEDIKSAWTRKKDGQGNPYGPGGLISNCCATLCAPMSPSLLQLRSTITQEQINEYEADKREGQRAADIYSEYYPAYETNKPYPVQPPSYNNLNNGVPSSSSTSHAQQPPPPPPPIVTTAPNNNMPATRTATSTHGSIEPRHLAAMVAAVSGSSTNNSSFVTNTNYYQQQQQQSNNSPPPPLNTQPYPPPPQMPYPSIIEEHRPSGVMYST
ncbi:palmitoyltransferase ZDHHC9-like isoform X2 [Convolutriloba macropyga]|uniref:palmitoyltransferase ZDHHC9-like isoform X2 n=1 Tax=Convolutriloba macropyga TaxID=536237 RepID=UPI003F5220BD